MICQWQLLAAIASRQPGSELPRTLDEMWRRFDEEACWNPAKPKVMQTSYREHLSCSIFEDDLPFSHTEGGGTLKLLKHLLPSHVSARVSHQTIKHDGKIIQSLVDKELMKRIKVSFE
jgi:hypothetical protein